MELVERNVTYPRYKKDENGEFFINNYLNYDALFVSQQNIRKNFFSNKFSVGTFKSEGLDKLSFCINRDFVNEENVLVKSLKNGGASLNIHGEYLLIYIHREFLNHEENIHDQVINVFWKLFLSGVFKLPKMKFRQDSNGTTIQISVFNYSAQNMGDFFNFILNKISLTNIEFFFDYQYDIQEYLDESAFFIYKDRTLYSLDYQVYKNGGKHISTVCVYDKAAQLSNVKNETVENTWKRIELRCSKNSFYIMRSLDCLNGTYEEIFRIFKKPLARKIKKLGIDWRKVHQVLLDYDKFKELLDIIYEKGKQKTNGHSQRKPKCKTTSEKNQDTDDDIPSSDSLSNEGILSLCKDKIHDLFKVYKQNRETLKYYISCGIKIARDVLDNTSIFELRSIIRGP